MICNRCGLDINQGEEIEITIGNTSDIILPNKIDLCRSCTNNLKSQLVPFKKYKSEKTIKVVVPRILKPIIDNLKDGSTFEQNCILLKLLHNSDNKTISKLIMKLIQYMLQENICNENINLPGIFDLSYGEKNNILSSIQSCYRYPAVVKFIDFFNPASYHEYTRCLEPSHRIQLICFYKSLGKQLIFKPNTILQMISKNDIELFYSTFKELCCQHSNTIASYSFPAHIQREIIEHNIEMNKNKQPKRTL